MRFSNQVVAVTGAGGGVGQVLCQAFAREGATVIAGDVTLEKAEAAVEAVGDSGSAHAVASDITDPGSVAALICAAEAAGGLDVLVHGAAVNKLGAFLDYDLADCRWILDVNVTGTFLVCQAAARAMIARGAGGRIVTISSNSAWRGFALRPIYGASKAAVSQLTQTMATELAPHGIAVNAIAPGPIDTPMTAWQPESICRAQEAVLPLARYARCEEIAHAILFLADRQSSYITGHVLAVDGGYAGAGLIHPELPSRSPAEAEA